VETDGFEMRPVDRVRWKGREEAVRIYDALGRRGDLRPEVESLCRFYSEAMARYESRDWVDARALFLEALKVAPNDGPSRTMAERCAGYVLDPPAPDWDGVLKAES